MNDKLEKTLKESVVAELKVLSRNLPGRREETHEPSVRVAGLRAEI
jgi:hypothetical protein